MEQIFDYKKMEKEGQKGEKGGEKKRKESVRRTCSSLMCEMATSQRTSESYFCECDLLYYRIK
jgi:hypothetical protein